MCVVRLVTFLNHTSLIHYHLTTDTKLHMTCRKMSQITAWQEQLFLHLVSDNVMEIGQNEFRNFFSNHASADDCFTRDKNTTK